MPAAMRDLQILSSPDAEPLGDFLARMRAMSSAASSPTTNHYGANWSFYSHHYGADAPLVAQRVRGPRSQGYPEASND